MRFFNKKAQSTLEYGIIVAVVVAALLSIQIYMKRGMQGRLRGSTDDIGAQFEAKNTSFSYTTKRTGTTVEEIQSGVTSIFAGEDSKGAPNIIQRKGTENVAKW